MLRSDGTVLKHFQHTEAMKAYMDVTESARMQGVAGSILLEYRFLLTGSAEFVEALTEGDSVEMRFRGARVSFNPSGARIFTGSTGWPRRWLF